MCNTKQYPILSQIVSEMFIILKNGLESSWELSYSTVILSNSCSLIKIKGIEIITSKVVLLFLRLQGRKN